MKTLLIFLFGMSLVACSSKNNKERDAYEDGQEPVVEYDEEADAGAQVDDIIGNDEGYHEQVAGENVQVVTDEYKSYDGQDSGSSIVGTGQFGEYIVQKNDTLMAMSFKIYGDLRLWRKIYDLNADKLNNPEMIQAGMRLKYEMPQTPFSWNPEGLPYLIVRGDTLMGISTKKYGTETKWREIWDNNRPLIRNPDLIYAGLTIYYKDYGYAPQASGGVAEVDTMSNGSSEMVGEPVSNEPIVEEASRDNASE